MPPKEAMVTDRRKSIKPPSRPETTANASPVEPSLQSNGFDLEITPQHYTGLVLDATTATNVKALLQKKDHDGVWEILRKSSPRSKPSTPIDQFQLPDDELAATREDAHARRAMVMHYSMEALQYAHKALDLHPWQLSVWLTVLKGAHDKFLEVISRTDKVNHLDVSTQAFESVMKQYHKGVPISNGDVAPTLSKQPFTWAETQTLATYYVESYVRQARLIAYVFTHPQEITRIHETRIVSTVVNIPPLSGGIEAEKWEAEKERMAQEAAAAAERIQLLTAKAAAEAESKVHQPSVPEIQPVKPLQEYTGPLPPHPTPESLFPSTIPPPSFIDPNFVSKTISQTATTYFNEFQKHLEKRLEHQTNEFTQRTVAALERALHEKTNKDKPKTPKSGKTKSSR